MLVFHLLVVLGLGALPAECATPQGHPHSILETSQDLPERHPNDVMPMASGRRDSQAQSGGEFQPTSQPLLGDNDSRMHVSLLSKNMPALWKAMSMEISGLKVKVNETRAALSDLADKVENIVLELETANSESHGQIEKELVEEEEDFMDELWDDDDDDDDDDEDDDDDDDEEEEEDDEIMLEDDQEENKDKGDDYKEVNDSSRVVITLTSTNDRPRCPPEFVDFDKQCLLLKAGRVASYAAAGRECAQQGGRLAVPSSPGGLASLATSLYPDSDEFWVGLRYDSTTRDWRRSDGNLDQNARTLLSLEDKTASSAGDMCALLKVRPSILWQAQPCGYFYSFICEADHIE